METKKGIWQQWGVGPKRWSNNNTHCKLYIFCPVSNKLKKNSINFVALSEKRIIKLFRDRLFVEHLVCFRVYRHQHNISTFLHNNIERESNNSALFFVFNSFYFNSFSLQVHNANNWIKLLVKNFKDREKGPKTSLGESTV